MIHTGDALVLGMRCEWSASLGQHPLWRAGDPVVKRFVLKIILCYGSRAPQLGRIVQERRQRAQLVGAFSRTILGVMPKSKTKTKNKKTPTKIVNNIFSRDNNSFLYADG